MREFIEIIENLNVTGENISGRGGKENSILSILKNIFPNLVRKSSTYYDCIDTATGIKYEIKKQQNLQWFDPSKFHNLIDEHLNVEFLFIFFNKNKEIDLIATIAVKDFIIKLNELNPKKWHTAVYATFHEAKSKHPLAAAQIKMSVPVRSMIRMFPNSFKIVWIND